jgi:hypothetical protein
MNCRQVDKYLYDYCDDILNPEQRAQIEEHLLNCPICRRIVDESLLESTILHEQWEIPALPDDFTDRVINQIACTAIQANSSTIYPHSQNHKKWSRRFISLAAMGAILLIMLYGPALLKNSGLIQIADQEPASLKTTRESIMAGKADQESLKAPAGAAGSEEIKQETANGANRQKDQEESPSSPAGEIKESYGTHSVTISNNDNSQAQDLNLMKAETAATPEAFPVQPVNLPASYVLLNKVDTAGSSTYTFGRSQSEEQIIINIAQLPLRQPVTSTYSRGYYIREEAAPAADKSEIQSGKGVTSPSEEQGTKDLGAQPQEQAKSKALPTTNTISYELEFNNQKFLLTISAKLPAEELSMISRDLQLSATK